MQKIRAGIFEFAAGNFESEEDKKAFEEFSLAAHLMGEGVVITPLYSKNGELMSFTVDSAKADAILTKIKEK